MHDKLVQKVDEIEDKVTSILRLINKSQYDTDHTLEKKRLKMLIKKGPNTTDLVQKIIITKELKIFLAL